MTAAIAFAGVHQRYPGAASPVLDGVDLEVAEGEFCVVLGIFTREERERAYDLLEVVGLAEHAGRRADRLSGGQKQRIGIARALAQGPSILLADEPVASLDPVTSEEILLLLQEINRREGITVVVSLHQVEFARRFGERIIALQNGEIALDTSASRLSDTEVTRIYGAAPAARLAVAEVAA